MQDQNRQRHDHENGSNKRRMKSSSLIVVALIIAVIILVWLVMTRETGPALTPIDPLGDVPPEAAIQPAPVTTLEPLNSVDEPEPEPQPEPEPEPAAPAISLPSLDNSDSAVVEHLDEAAGPQLTPLLTGEHLIRKFARAIYALEEGELVSQHRPFKEPSKPFSVSGEGKTFEFSDANAARYAPYIEALAQLGSDQMAQIYRTYYPLLENAYNELGVDKGSFKEVTLRAIDQLLSAPEQPDNLTLERPVVMYQYQDTELEELPEAQKLMLRIGPENRAKFEDLLRSVRRELQAP